MKKIITAGVVGVVVIAAAVSPYFIGIKAENRFKEGVVSINAGILEHFDRKNFIELNEYNRGWSESKATTTIANAVIAKHEISQGPFKFFGISKIDTKIDIPEHINKRLVEFFDGKDPYSITTKILFSGATEFNFTIPALAKQKEIPGFMPLFIDWQGLSYTNKISGGNQESLFTLPKLSVDMPKMGGVNIENITSKGSGDSLFNAQLNLTLPAKVNSTGELVVDKISMDNQMLGVYSLLSKLTSKATIKDNHLNSSLLLGEFSMGARDGKIAIKNVDFSIEAADAFSILRQPIVESDFSNKLVLNIKNVSIEANHMAKIDFSYKQTAQMEDNLSGLLTHSGSLALDNLNATIPAPINVADIVTSAKLDYKVEGLSKANAANYYENTLVFLKKIMKVHNFYEFMGIVNQFNTDTARQYYVGYLKGTPTATIDFSSQGGKGQASVNINAKLLTADDTLTLEALKANPNRVLKRLQSKVMVTISESLVDTILATMGMTADDMVAFKATAVKRIPFIVKDKNLVIDIEYKDSQFYINGNLDSEFLDKLAF